MTKFCSGLQTAFCVTACALLPGRAAAQLTQEQKVLLALQNMRDEGFNHYLTNSGGPGGLYINWIWTNHPPVASNMVNMSGTVSGGTVAADANPTNRHDRLTDLDYTAALSLYKLRFPTDTQFDAELSRYAVILTNETGLHPDEIRSHPDQRGWVYWAWLDITKTMPGLAGCEDAMADMDYKQYTNNLAKYPGMTPLFLKFGSDPCDYYTTANEIEDACVLIVNGKNRELTNFISAGENLLAFLKSQAYNPNVRLWCNTMGHVFTSTSLTTITLPGNETTDDPVVKPGEIGEVCEALVYAEAADSGHGYGAWAKEVLDGMQPSVNTYQLWDSNHGGYWSQDTFTVSSGTTNIGNPTMHLVPDTRYKEVGRYTVVECALLAANATGLASYSSNMLAQVNQAALDSCYADGHGWPYQENGDFTLYKGDNWVTSESISHAVRSVLTYELANTTGSGGARPSWTSVSINSGNLILSGSGGPSNGTYRVLISTDLALPVTNWAAVTTSAFDTSGNFGFTNRVDSTGAVRFFNIVTP